jgi:aminobenzoyl-glutamate utilization protein B
MDITKWIEENRDLFIMVSDQIWELAELGLLEFRSAELLANTLEKTGFEVERGVAEMPTAFVASYGKGKPVIAILGEYDALPGLSQEKLPYRKPLVEGGNGHGCGHNLFGAGSLAGAMAVARAIQTGEVQGTVRFYGTPGEEAGDGKVFMAKAGLFDDVDIALAWHPGPLNVNAFVNFVAVIIVSFKFYGKAAHAAVDPYNGRSALDALELMNVGVNYLRQRLPPDCPVTYVVTHGGNAPNVVPDFTESCYMIRGNQNNIREVYERVINVGKGAALMTDTRMEVDFHDASSASVLNEPIAEVIQAKMEQVIPPTYSKEEEEFARELAQTFSSLEENPYVRLMGPQVFEALTSGGSKLLINNVLPLVKVEKVFTGGSDVGDVSQVVPTGQFIATAQALGTPGHSWQAVAQHGMSIGHKGMLYAGKVLAAAAVEFMQKPELVEQARQDFLRRTKGKPYQSLIPDGVKPHSIYIGKE